MKVDLSGGMDAQGFKIIEALDSDSKITNNSFRIVKESSLMFWGRRDLMILPFFIRMSVFYFLNLDNLIF